MIQINIPFLVLLVLTALAAGLTWVWYRHTHPAISERLRYLLSALRFVVILGVLILLFKPRIDFWQEKVTLPRLAVYVDNSASMGVVLEKENRRKALQNTVGRLTEILADRNESDWFAFNTAIEQAAGDSIHLSESGTDFNVPLSHFGKYGYDQAIIISDGNHSSGVYPLQGRDFPGKKIYTIGLGSASVKEDIFIREVNYPAVGYQGQPQTVHVVFGGSGLEKDTELRFILKSGKSILGQKTVLLPKGEAESEVNLDIRPDALGLIKYRLELEPLEREQNTANNRFIFVQDILKRRLKITILANTPGYDTKFMNHVLNQEPDFHVINLVQKSGSRFYGNFTLRLADSSDVIIISDYPDNRTTESLIAELSRLIEDVNPSLLFMTSGKTNHMALTFKSRMQALIDHQIHASVSEVNPLPAPDGGGQNRLLQIFNDGSANLRFWEGLPPIRLTERVIPAKGAKTVLYGSIRGGMDPLLLIRDNGSQKLAWMGGSGYWRWHFLLRNDEMIAEGYSRFIKNLVRWLADKRSSEPFRIDTDKKVYYQGENVHISATLLGGDYQPVHDARVEFQVKWGEQSFKVDANTDSLGIYKALFVPPQQGRYRIAGKAFRDDNILAENETQLEVIPYNPELNKISLNEDFLRKLSRLGNGRYFSASQLDTMSRFPGRQAIKVNKRVEMELWFKPLFLILLIVFISLEWYLRKHHGLV